jgi:undecaprenyl-diphosphatase
MDLTQQILLAILQGLTEFLPISSSAHLILLPKLVGWADQGLDFDIALHVGTLSAVVIYFRRELQSMTRDWLRSLKTRQQTPESRLAWCVLFGTIPVGLFGLLFKDAIELYLRSPLVIAIATIVFGLLLWWADVVSKRRRDEYSLRASDVLFIGIAQAIALIPGTSRSGITITAGLALGLSRQAAARFSFLLSIPVITLAGLLTVRDILVQHHPIDGGALLTGALISGITAYLCIYLFLKLLERVGMLPFVIYRLLLGLYLLLAM